MKENACDTGKEIVCTTRKPGKLPKGIDKSRKNAKAILSKKSQ